MSDYNNLFLRKSIVNLTNAQIKALPTTPFALVVTPGSGILLVPHLVVLLSNVSAGAYTNVNADGFMYAALATDAWSTYCANDSGNSLTYLSALLSNTNHRLVLREYSDTTDPTPQWGPLSVPGPRGDNMALNLTINNNGSGNLTGGNAANTITVVTYYSLEAAP